MTQFRLSITYLEHGWLCATVTAEETTLSMTVSYLSDAPAELLSQVVALLQGAAEARCGWQEEPGEYRWVLARRGDLLDVTILWFHDNFSQKPDEKGELLFHTECDLLRFAAQLKGQLQQLLNGYGPEGYRERWRHEFPMARFEELKALIGEGKREWHRHPGG